MDILADTNVILRRLHRLHPQHVAVRDALRKLDYDGHRICVTSQNLIECWVVCTRPVENNGFGLTPNLTTRVLGSIERSVFRLPDSDEVYAEWRRLVSVYGVSGKKAHDARIVAAMTIHGITNILTFDNEGFRRFPRINVIDPLAPAPR